MGRVAGRLRQGGCPAARDLARDYWLTPTPERHIAYRAICHPMYDTRPIRDPAATARVPVPGVRSSLKELESDPD